MEHRGFVIRLPLRQPEPKPWVLMAASKADDAVLVDFVTLSAADRPGVAATGWDPYEVWRTRVLLPRLAGKRRATISRRVTVSGPAGDSVIDESGDEPITCVYPTCSVCGVPEVFAKSASD